MCGKGNYCPANSTEPTPCPVGTYGVASTASTERYCYPCMGSYNNQTGAVRCTRCGLGHFCPHGAVNPTPCPIGSYGPSTSSKRCYPCGSGSYSNVTGASRCTDCPAGHYCESNSTEPIPCPTGSYSRHGRAGRCYSCSAGRYSSVTGATECTACPAGYYCENNSTEPTPCPEGMTSSPSSRSVRYCRDIRPVEGDCPAGTFKNDIEECEQCSTGHYCPGGSTERTPCPKGTYSSYSNAWKEEFCRECYAGYYGDEEGLASCKSCPAGSYCEAGSVEPTSCPDGHTSYPYSRSEDHCRPVS